MLNRVVTLRAISLVKAVLVSANASDRPSLASPTWTWTWISQMLILVWTLALSLSYLSLKIDQEELVSIRGVLPEECSADFSLSYVHSSPLFAA